MEVIRLRAELARVTMERNIFHPTNQVLFAGTPASTPAWEKRRRSSRRVGDKYAFIQRNKLVWPIAIQCHVLLVSVTGYHQHRSLRVDLSRRRHMSDEALLVHISTV